jgi:serine/threonine-protein kinase
LTVETLAGGRYRVERPLGHGGMASVYLAHDDELDRPVALKLLSQAVGGDPDFRKRFLREAKLAARLTHPNLVAVYDAGEEDDTPYIVMECVDGEPLSELLARRGPLPAPEVVELALQACAGLQHAHDAGLVHRDVKPANLLVRNDDVLKIADFGIARAGESTRLTKQGTILGTAAYLAPEQARGAEVTPAADLYSLGAVLYEALTGKPPFAASNLLELARLQEEGTIRPPRDLEPSVPRDVEAAVMRCLARDPAFRPPSAARLAQELTHTRTAPTRPLEPATAPAARPWLRRFESVPLRGTWIWIGLALAVGLLALAAGLLRATRGGDATPPPPARIAPVEPGSTPAEEARNLARWLRAYSK